MRRDERTNMARVISAVVIALGLGKLMIVHLVNKFLAFYGTRKFVTGLIKTPHGVPS